MRDKLPERHLRRTEHGRDCGTIPPREPLVREHATFAIVRKGYDPMQVDQHLAWLAAAPPPGEDDAYLEADRILADARRLAAEICLEVRRREREAEAAANRAQRAAEQAEAELSAARAEAARLLADARARAADTPASPEVARSPVTDGSVPSTGPHGPETVVGSGS